MSRLLEQRRIVTQIPLAKTSLGLVPNPCPIELGCVGR